MARRTECYVDTSALIAFLDRSDSYHPIFRRLFADLPIVILTQSQQKEIIRELKKIPQCVVLLKVDYTPMKLVDQLKQILRL